MEKIPNKFQMDPKYLTENNLWDGDCSNFKDLKKTTHDKKEENKEEKGGNFQPDLFTS